MGQLLKILVIAIGISMILLAVRRMLVQRRKSDDRQGAIQSMVQCTHCGMYTPQSQAISEDGQFYCNEAHRQIASKK